ncbi:thioesterase [Virgibacillus dakarensis]|uniref:Thioesterase n=1 Tax=Lentibacillus populi TaxID=1827502 RepID=A0A9W5TX00_9BACI|nr:MULTISPECIES: thioesterase family protein [Bacillaceae]MBT2217272.1 thioesterase family protein [Virgibacillus dakarensis]MTW86206.1 thioesterase [Virgibacillus dakarensis]GGB38408.1 thioesterase [Lentibacillus populi]
MTGKVIIEDHVRKEWIDYNGHMNDAEYVRAFSWGVDRFMKLIGIEDIFREEQNYTMFTLESHVCYLAEMKLDEPFEVQLQMLDYDAKRAHVFFELYGEGGKRAATSEQMLMGMDQTSGRPAPFPDEVFAKVKELADSYTPKEKPKEAGRVIGIRRKK